MADVSMQQIRSVGAQQKLTFDRQSETVVVKDQTTGWQGRVLSWIKNKFSSDYRADKRDVMQGFRDALVKDYGAIAGRAFDDALGGVQAKSLTGRRIEQVLVSLQTAMYTQVDTCDKHIPTVQPGGTKFDTLLAELGIAPELLTDTEKVKLSEAIARNVKLELKENQEISPERIRFIARETIAGLPSVNVRLELRKQLEGFAGRNVQQKQNVDTICKMFEDFDNELRAPWFPGPKGPQPLSEETRNAFYTKLSQKAEFFDLELGNACRMDRPQDIEHTFLTVLAEVASPKDLQHILSRLDPKDTLRLLEQCFSADSPYGNFREGAYNIVSTLRRLAEDQVKTDSPVLHNDYWQQNPEKLLDLLHNVSSSRYHPKDLTAALKAETELSRILSHLEGLAVKRTDDLVKDFGEKADKLLKDLRTEEGAILDAQKKGTATKEQLASLPKIQSAISKLEGFQKAPPTKDQWDTFVRTFGFRVQDTQAYKLGSGKGGALAGAEVLLQTLNQLDAIGSKKDTIYLDGLKHVVLAVPTAGKSLDKLSYVPSMVQELGDMLNRTNERCGTKHKLSDHPIIIFDQSKKDLFEQNGAYLKDLGDRTGASLHHVSMAQVKEIGRKLGIEELFDTRGNDNAGYGGCRNITYLLGPMLKEALLDSKSGIKTAQDLVDADPAYLKGLLKNALTNANKQMVLMGDDDTTLHPGFFEARSYLASTHKDGYAKIATLVLGRATTTIPDVVNNNSFEGLKYDEDSTFQGTAQINSIAQKSMGSTAFEGLSHKMVEHQMAACLSHPGSCLDLPLPSEEGLFSNYNSYTVDYLGQGVHHPSDRFEEIGKRVQGMASYSTAANQAIEFLGVNDTTNNKPSSDILPWNHPSVERFQSLSEAYVFASDKKTHQDIQKAFLTRLVKAPINEGLANTEEVFQQMHSNPQTRIDRDDSLRVRERTRDIEAGLKTVGRDYEQSIKFRRELVKAILDEFDKLPSNTPNYFNVKSGLDPQNPDTVVAAMHFMVEHGGSQVDKTLAQAIETAKTNCGPFNKGSLTDNLYLVSKSTLFRFHQLATTLSDIAES